MDGHRRTHPTPRRARAGAWLAATLAALALASSAAAEPAAAPTAPDLRWPADGPAVRTASAIAQEHWGVAPCGGHVDVAWEDLDPSIDARSSWANDHGQYSRPLENTSCEISLSPRGQWDWPKLCTIVAHEVGHLVGHDHVDDPRDVMYFSYVRPLPECASTPEPEAAVAAAEPSAATAKGARPADRRAQASRRAAAPKARTRRAAAPKARTPKAQAPKARAPKTHAPKARAPKTHGPRRPARRRS